MAVSKIGGDHQLSPVQVAFGLSGNHPGFLAEFEVALKSVLLNAPLERNISIHILADQEAFASLKGIFNRTELSTWLTRNPTEIHAHDVTPDVPQMKREIYDVFKAHTPNLGSDWIHGHTMGAYFRLFLERFVSKTSAKHILYLDTDVVIMANLEALWGLVERQQLNALFHWGKNMCSGFVVMNLQRMNKILPLAKGSSFTDADGTMFPFRDQSILQAVNISYPNEVNILPPGWDMTVTEIWQSNNHPYDKKFPNVGMLHFNGGGSSKEAYFGGENGSEHNFITEFKDTWGNGKFYATLPWEWARYQAKSLVRPGSKGHPIQFFFSKGMQGGQNISESEPMQ
eukprot:CAMPEP_0201721722 /NCGR_PEP_ID=MMETSP0593-20130828/6330_1 /ASSEMBLY_ACC=CAM_ASM_000672 /TAXON_ID=267983 /ORGANISM="Skeletonema japonicum, Strain CCMP2506" /LENGTH=341 /DNA_ID=CAMNT_0048212585 /DNA_START=39 /DNA_END=1064 /DNA_ORIENTATION=-